MVFDYEAFKNKLRLDPCKNQLIERWETISNVDNIRDEPFYEYLKQFKALTYKLPETLKHRIDHSLLLKLVVGSFSSKYELIMENLKPGKKIVYDDCIPQLVINVKTREKSLSKVVNQLNDFQIARLFDIYCEEQIRLHLLKLEDFDENKSIDKERQIRINKYNYILKNIEMITARRKVFL